MKLSDKLQKVLDYLMSRPDPSSKEIEDACNVCSARDWIRHLRDKGYTIDRKDTEEFGARVSRWTLIQKAPVEGLLF